MMAIRRLSVGRRNLLERLARSRAARDLREFVWRTVEGLSVVMMLIGLWVTVTWLIEIGAPALARWIGWM
ncbi:hypothetical protein [Symbiobacterium terraclitae]|uniref:hypothetical protein n=1 Tax=Symbiobacterium terraclitae TaxID=557451 RepID=UPI0035B55F59